MRVSTLTSRRNGNAVSRELGVNWQLYVMILLPVIYVAVFMYGPIYGIQIAFREYIATKGITGSPWVGLKYFEKFIDSYEFSKIFKNTLRISLYSLLAGFPIPILFALMLHVTRGRAFRKTLQMVSYAPYFISTVVLVGIMSQILSTHSYGVINSLLGAIGVKPIPFRTSAKLFDHVFVWAGVWQGMGWGSIIYIAALTTVDAELYEAATIDGASILQKVRYIDIPSILPTIAINLILSSGSILGVGFEKVILMQNTANLSRAEVISTYVYKLSLGSLGTVAGYGQVPNYSYSTAIGLFNSLICFAVLVLVNYASKKLSKTGLW